MKKPGRTVQDSNAKRHAGPKLHGRQRISGTKLDLPWGRISLLQLVLAVGVTAFGCAGCVAGHSFSMPSSAIPLAVKSAAQSQSHLLRIQHPALLSILESERGASWMLSSAKKRDLLYVGDIYDVTVYSYPDGKLEGRLKGFYEIAGECVDKRGDVFIVDTGDSKIIEYAHGGKVPVATLQASASNPIGCALDPTTGNLAVSGGNVTIYPNAEPPAKVYTDPNMSEFGWCGYDSAGDLYVDGVYYDDVAFAELPKDNANLVSVTLDQSFRDTGGIQWDGKYLAVGDQSVPKIYEFKMVGSQGTEIGATDLGSGAQAVHQFFIIDHRLIAPNFGWIGSQFYSDVLFFKYPKGGDAYEIVKRHVQASEAVVVSKAHGP